MNEGGFTRGTGHWHTIATRFVYEFTFTTAFVSSNMRFRTAGFSIL
jgi:hypothetical protein